jgi:acyl-CoA synthetase (AMP-forming)/AMP-acid ligase II
VRPGDPIAIDLPNGAEWVVALVGVLLSGAIAVPINTRLAPDEREDVLRDSGAVLVFDADTPVPHGEPYVYESGKPTDTAAIFYTSGTTGRSKGAVSTHQALLGVSENMIRAAAIPRGSALTSERSCACRCST